MKPLNESTTGLLGLTKTLGFFALPCHYVFPMISHLSVNVTAQCTRQFDFGSVGRGSARSLEIRYR